MEKAVESLVKNGATLQGAAMVGAAMLPGRLEKALPDLPKPKTNGKTCETKKNKANTAKEGFNVKDALKRLCGDRTKHKNQKPDSTPRNPRKHEPKHKKSDSEHIPSQEFVKEGARQRFEGLNLSDKAMKCIENQISGNLDTMIAPHLSHQNKSNIVNPTIADTKKEVAKDLHKQARKEADIWEEEAKKLEKTGKKGKRCAKLIRENLEFFRNLPKDYFTKIMDAALVNCAGK